MRAVIGAANNDSGATSHIAETSDPIRPADQPNSSASGAVKMMKE